MLNPKSGKATPCGNNRGGNKRDPDPNLHKIHSEAMEPQWISVIVPRDHLEGGPTLRPSLKNMTFNREEP